MSLFRTLKNINMSSGNPSGLTDILPGGAGGNAVAGSEPNPMVGTPSQDTWLGTAIDQTAAYLAENAVQGNLVILARAIPVGLTAAQCAGGGYWQVSAGYATTHFPFAYGVVSITNGGLWGAGAEMFPVLNGPVQALCTATTTAIAYGSLLCSDGQGGLTTFQPPSGGPTPTVTQIGTSGTTVYHYALVPVSADGIVGTIGTSGGTTAGNATLTNSNYNQITWTSVADAASYIIVRTSSAGTPTSVGVIGQVAASDGVFNDTGLAIQSNTSTTQFFEQLAAPSAPTVTNGGASGSTSWSYKISAIGPNGVWSVAESSAGTNSSGPATLTTANYNSITWSTVTGATLYAIDRTSAGGTPSTTGIIGYYAVTPGTTPTIKFEDSGLPVIGTYASLVTTTPNATPRPGAVLGFSMGTLAASTTTPTLVNVWIGGF